MRIRIRIMIWVGSMENKDNNTKTIKKNTNHDLNDEESKQFFET